MSGSHIRYMPPCSPGSFLSPEGKTGQKRVKSRVGHRRRRTTPPQQAHPFAQRLFDRVGLKKQIWAASPSGKRSPPARPQLRKSAHRRAYQRPGTKKAPRRCWAGGMMTAQWHMVCRAPSATPGKKKSPLLETVGFSAERAILGNDCLRWTRFCHECEAAAKQLAHNLTDNHRTTIPQRPAYASQGGEVRSRLLPPLRPDSAWRAYCARNGGSRQRRPRTRKAETGVRGWHYPEFSNHAALPFAWPEWLRPGSVRQSLG